MSVARSLVIREELKKYTISKKVKNLENQKTLDAKANIPPVFYRVRHRNWRLLETLFPGNIRSRLEECLHKGGGHLEDVMFKK